VDAAIATNAMMGVVSPMMNGIGGDLFAIVYDAKANKLYGLNASGWAPKNLTPELLKKKGLRDMPETGVNTITVPVPSTVGRSWPDKFGRKKLSDDLVLPSKPHAAASPSPNGWRCTGTAQQTICAATMPPQNCICPRIILPKSRRHFHQSRSRGFPATDCGTRARCLL